MALLGMLAFHSPSGERALTLSSLGRSLVAVAVVQLSLYYGDVYELAALRSRIHLFLRQGRSILVAALLLPLLYYLAPPISLAPWLLFLYMPVAVAVVFVGHSFLHWAGGSEALTDNVLILGTGHSAQQVAVEVLRRAPIGYRLAGLLGEHSDEVRRSAGPQVVGTMDGLMPLLAELKANLIVVALDDSRGRLPVNDLLRCRVAGIRVEDAPTFYERLTGKLLVSDLRPSWLVFSPGFHKPRWFLATRRVL